MTLRWSQPRRVQCTSFFLFVSSVCALPLGAQPLKEGPPNSPDLAAFFRALDKNGDGALGPYEAAEAILSLTRDADQDGDGAMQFAELERVLSDRADETASEVEEVFDEFDGDRDGRIVLDALPDEFAPFLATADLDGDGSVTRAEIFEARPFDSAAPFIEAEFMGILDEFDGDGDGAFALGDVPAEDRSEFGEEFEALDLDGDGTVTRAELQARVDAELAGATFTVDGDTALMEGVIGATTPGRVLELVLEHPEVEVIAMGEVPGSMDDHANLRAALLVNRAGLRTEVVPGGEIASGGVDFFLAGHDRSLASDARVGVHSWAGMDETGDELPRGHPEHAKYLDFYRAVGTDADFYWFTLGAAPADGIHWMTQAELKQFEMGEISPALEGSERSGVDEQVIDNEDVPDERQATHIGGCVLRSADGPVPSVVLGTGDLMQGKQLSPFASSLTSHGIELRAESGVSEEFLMLVARTLGEMFPDAPDLDRAAQEKVVRAMYERRALLPVPKSERSLERLFAQDPHAFERMEAEHSVCDIIMAGVKGGLVMEVVEHLLHTVTDVGLHTVYPEVWGLSRDSKLWAAMQRAIDLGCYDVSGYDDLDGEPQTIRDRILMQEFAYWYITTKWNIQTQYGPNEAEWTLRTPAELRASFPTFDAAYGTTAGKILACPSPGVLEALAAMGR